MDTGIFTLEERGLDLDRLAHAESLFALGNGYLGMRGHPVSRIPSYHPGVFINGFYEIGQIPYGEDAYGFARTSQTMLDLPDCRYMTINIDGEVVSITSAWRRELDFAQGLLTEELTWTSAAGKRFVITWQTLLSMEEPSRGMVRLSVDGAEEAEISILSAIALPVIRTQEGLDPRIASLNSVASLKTLDTVFHTKDHGYAASFRTKESGLSLFCSAYHRLNTEAVVQERIDDSSLMPTLLFTARTKTLVLEKTFFYRQKEKKNKILGWEEVLASQKEHYSRFWQASDVVIKGDDELQQALRFNLFQLHQSVGRDGATSLAAKGLTGLGYEGQYFWDTEIYAMPLFTHTDPSVARALLTYRIATLDKARQRAEELSQKGALYPWRTINGLEASAYFPASTAQYHINADIAHALIQYLQVTEDYSILEDGGFDLLMETARLWVDLGFYDPRKRGQFCLHEVTGPDEYSALVDNNLYTNVMAAYHLEQAAHWAAWMKDAMPKVYQKAIERLALGDEEILSFAQAAEAMYIPFDKELQIHAQDDRFLTLQEWDEEKKGPIRHPMLLNYHPLVIYRHRLIKQADTILTMVLQSHRFTWYHRRRNFLYYERYTTGDSSLSAAVQAVAAYDVNLPEIGLEYLRETALMDIADLHQNTKDGLHTAAMAGSWMTLIYGIAGYRLQNQVPTFRPNLPEGWDELSFHLRYGQSVLTVQITEEETTYRTDTGTLSIRHRSTPLTVGEGGVRIKTKAVCKAVIFDLDGVITSTDGYHYRAWKALSDKEGWAFDESVNQRLRGVSRQESLQIILDYNNIVLDEGTKIALAEEKNRTYRASLADLGPKDILDGIPSLLGALKSRSIKVAIASASHNAPYILEKLGLTDSFDYIVDAKEVGVGKPDPEVFVRAAEALGVDVEECSGIEDAPAGIEAIRAAGMRAVGVGQAVDPSTCDVHVGRTDLLNLETIIF